jgi:hypothetical protein
LESPEYVAVSVLMPAAREDVDRDATPVLLTTPELMVRPLLLNVTMPVGTTPLTAAIVADMETACPELAGFGEAVRVTCDGLRELEPAAYSSAPIDGGFGRGTLL